MAPDDGGLSPVVDHAARVARRADRPIAVGLAGPVAAGKSTAAAAIAVGLGSHPYGLQAAVVSTDCFLHPNRVLEQRGLLLQKGFPASYDLSGLRQVVADLRSGARALSVPVYSHEQYDVVEEQERIVAPDVLLLEGVNALQDAPAGDPGPGPVELVDVAVYLHVEEAHARTWFGERFVALTRESRAGAGSFYAAWADLDDESVRAVADEVWTAVNGVNLVVHILPSRANAHLVVTKGADHEVTRLEWPA